VTELVDVWCPRCGQHARVPVSALPATCNNHDGHHHRRGELMTTDRPNAVRSTGTMSGPRDCVQQPGVREANLVERSTHE